MKDIDAVRRENLARLVQELGSVVAVAKLMDRSESQISQLLNGSANSKTGKPRGMRKDTARRIEHVTGKSPGWLDTDHRSGEADSSSATSPWNAYEAASASTRAAVDLLLLPKACRNHMLSTSPQAMTAVELLELYAPTVLGAPQQHHGADLKLA